ncbi:MAG: 30S ribosomal protein S2 [Alphaproteobacteria bacterium]|nr:30S ribosomal protein S2 [Alphaproteobacteria bacterium]
MALPTFTMRQLIQAGVHFGHHTRRWNPKMGQYIFGTRDKVHIIDLQQTVPMLYQAMQAVRDVVSNGGRVLFVGTKRQAQEHIQEAATRCSQYYVNHRWLGGMMTNWGTISKSIKRLNQIDRDEAEGRLESLTKKERLNIRRDREKLERALGGIKNMGGRPDILFVIDTLKESLAIQEANKLGIPVVAICDTNSPLDGIDYVIPGNDDAIRAVKTYCELISGAVLDGIQAELESTGKDRGAATEAPIEDALEATEKKKPAAKKKAPAKKAAAKKAEDKPAAKKAPAEDKPAAKKTPAKKAAAKKADEKAPAEDKK